MKLITYTVLLLMFCSSGFSQNTAKATIEVDGVCGMCKKRIEKACLKTKGVKSAVWSIETHALQLIYNSNKVDLETVESNLAAVGHDTRTVKATDADFAQLAACCKYRDTEVVKGHKN